MDERLNIGARLKTVRMGAGLSQPEMAKRLGVSYPTIQKWEQKGTEKVAVSLVEKVCADFGVDRVWLVFGEGEAPVTGGEKVDFAITAVGLAHQKMDDLEHRIEDLERVLYSDEELVAGTA